MRRRTPAYRFRPEVEALESRELPAVTARRPAASVPVKPAAAKVTAAPPKPVAVAPKVTAPPKPVTPAPKVVATIPQKSVATAKPASLGIKPFSDPADTTFLATSPGRDVTDLYVFPSPADPNNVVLALDLHPFIPPGQGAQVDFDPNEVFEFKISTQDNGVADKVIQVSFPIDSVGPQQIIQVSGPEPLETAGSGDIAGDVLEPIDSVTGIINQPFTTSNGVRVFAGVREDPFFFDMNQFFTLLPDRANPLVGPTFVNTHGQTVSTTPADPNQLMDSSFRSPQQAQDFYKNLNTLSIVVEMPRAMLGQGKIQVWATSNEATGMALQEVAYGHNNHHPGKCVTVLKQLDRVGNPLVNALFADAVNGQHGLNDADTPTDDPGLLGGEVVAFMTHAAGRSQAVATAAAGLLTPSALVVDLSKQGPASYLGAQIGNGFGGRALTDDVVDTTLGIAFGNTIPSLGLAPDDGQEVPSLTTDNVTANTAPKHFQSVFPYLGEPR